MDTTLEEAGLDVWLLFGCQYQLSYLREYGKLPRSRPSMRRWSQS